MPGLCTIIQNKTLGR